MRKHIRIFPIFFLFILFAACGKQSNSGFNGDAFATQESKTKTKAKNVPSTKTSSIDYDSEMDPSEQPKTPTESAQCTASKNAVNRLYQSCSSTLYENDDVVPRSCMNAFSALSYLDCSSLNSKVSQALSACGSLFKQYSSYLPSSCRSAISALGT